MANEDVRKIVGTQFLIHDQATAALGGIGAAFSGVGSIIGRVTSLISPLTLAMGGLAGALSVKAIADLGSQFEQTQTTMAGFLSSLGISKDYNAGFTEAADVMEKIRVAAAALPGEAEDYIQVFKAGLPFVAKAVGGTVDEMTAFTNRYTAIAKTLQVDSGQAARDLALLLREGKGGAGLDVKTWTQLLPFMKQVQGQADLTQEKFNAMTAPERAKLMEETFKKLDPMLKKSAGSFDAMIGAFTSNTKEIMRLGSAPLFEGMKRGLERVNALMFDAEGKITPFASGIVAIGSKISEVLVSALEAAVSWMKKLYDWFTLVSEGPAFQQMRKSFELIREVFEKTRGVISANPGGAAGGIGAMAGTGAALAGGASGPAALIAGPIIGGLINFATRTEEVTALFGNLSEIVAIAVAPLASFMEAMSIAGDIMGDFFAGTLNQAAEAVIAIWTPISELTTYLWGLAGVVLEQIQPALRSLWNSIGRLIDAIGNNLNPILKMLGEIISYVAGIIAEDFVIQITLAAKVVGGFIDAMTAFINWLTKLIGPLAAKLDLGGGTGPGGKNPIQDFMDKWKMSGEQREEQKKGEAWWNAQMNAEKKGMKGGAQVLEVGGGRATQDFRYSKFEITQKFAEGFDPDRIAVAFAQDIGKIGENKLQSGFEPLFAVR